MLMMSCLFLRLGIDGEAEEEQVVPTFRLGDDVNDDVPTSSMGQPTAQPMVPITEPVIQPERPVINMSGPVFDLSSELEDQLPPQRSRPTLNEEPEESSFFNPSPLSAANNTASAAPAESIFTNTPVEMTSASSFTPAEYAPTASVFGEELSFDQALSQPEFTPVPFQEQILDSHGYGDEYPVKDEAFERRIFEAMLPTLVELATEIRRFSSITQAVNRIFL